MVAIFKKAEWGADLEEDDTDLGKALIWAVRGLVQRCSDCRVRPVGTLTVADRTLDEESVVRSYEFILELDAAPVFAERPAFAFGCVARDCEHVEYGATVEETEAAVLKHWDVTHSAGDQFA
jgi:hypothetical protein